MHGLSLAGRTALVTGGAGGIGAAICRDLAECGARVVVADIDVDRAKELAAGLPDATAVGVDLDDAASIERCVGEVGPVDILVNNGGVTKVERFAESDHSQWDRLWRINLRGPMLLSRLLVPAMVERNWGRAVFISSDSARVGAGGEVVYSSVKAGLLGLAKSLARETARFGVTSNVVCPGMVDTPLLRSVAKEKPALLETMVRLVPQRRIGDPEDVSGLVAFLCTPRAGYLTGQVFSASGGMTMS
ncbi:SDR family NAD(P)-dependent oxidoreductase [Dactylosporangium sp. AC04546]|uniref:SDR family NAD(P)-dependent oxidoreductase n=1 Tax=Dactylosporangium sp. AC04546 TaxID=2862460 RepID=UPI001EDF5F6F|nr:SDR family NAD(P)-dependent oxidoreductase [Dactylosporangium sp. AC04546]WVK88226.1 SDR family NAD(P)-dependent oxidoreductase [Dactylosporangium sp. AC04546]